MRSQSFDGNNPIEPRIERPVDFTHSPGANQVDDFIRTKPRTGTQRHVRILTLPNLS
jgi:hypothetical protein